MTRSPQSAAFILTSPPSESQFSFSIELSGEKKMMENYVEIFVEYAKLVAELVRRREEHSQATPDRLIDEKQLYYDAAGKCSKGRVYGSGHLPRGRRDMKIPVPVRPESRWCGVQSLMQLFKGLHSSRLLCRASWECAWTSEQAPFRHHHRRHHHLMSIISRLGWIRLVHHSSSTTMMMRTTMISWMRSTLVTKVSTPKESLKGVQGVGEGYLQVLLFRRTVL
ncbi:hypothetical protein Scep_010006 [Stephania cephalantha]|uniref:Uncharacterized protein n=1 Tax=Stephania cephalantha TaxID=152367 RepID=A0AAP0JWG9_9MAGN